MKYSIKLIALAAVLPVLVACNSTGPVDYAEDIETPDVLLKDTQAGTTAVDVDKSAADRAEQVKPDALLERQYRGKTVKRNKDKVTSESASAKKRDSALEVDDPLLDEVDPH